MTTIRVASSVLEGSSPENKVQAVENPPLQHRILVIDHDEDARLVVCDRLVALGFDVAGEDNGVSGLSRIARECTRTPFAGLLVELNMPMLGGMAVLQEMKDRYPDIPVIAMSDSIRIDRLREAIKLGAKEYLVKPFDAELLKRKCLRVFLGRGYSA